MVMRLLGSDCGPP